MFRGPKLCARGQRACGVSQTSEQKQVLDFQSMSQPKNITDFVYFEGPIPNS